MIQEVKERVKVLLTDVICQVCTKEVPHKSQIQIEGTLCITSDTHPTFAIQIAQLLSKAEPLTIQNLTKSLYSPPGFGNGNDGGPHRSAHGGSISQKTSDVTSVQSQTFPGSNTSLYVEADPSKKTGLSVQTHVPETTNLDIVKVSPVSRIPPLSDVPRRLTQPGDTKHYIHPIKRRRLSSDPSLEMKPPAEPARRRESEGSISLGRSRFHGEDPEEIYQNVQRSAKLILKKVNIADEVSPNYPAHQATISTIPEEFVSDMESSIMSTNITESSQLKNKLIGQPMVLTVDDSNDNSHSREMVMVIENQKPLQSQLPLKRRHSEVMHLTYKDNRAIIEHLQRRDSLHNNFKSNTESDNTYSFDKPEQIELSGQNVKDKVRSFLYKREKSVERLVDSGNVSGRTLLCHSSSAPSLSALASAASTAAPVHVPTEVKLPEMNYPSHISRSNSICSVGNQGDVNIPTDLSRKSSISSTGSSGSVIREMLQNCPVPSYSLGNIDISHKKSNFHVTAKSQTDQGGVIRHSMYDTMTKLDSNDKNSQFYPHDKSLTEVSSSEHLGSEVSGQYDMVQSQGGLVFQDTDYETLNQSQPESYAKGNNMTLMSSYPKYYLTTVGSQVVPVTIVPSSHNLTGCIPSSNSGMQPTDIPEHPGPDGDPGTRLTTLLPKSVAPTSPPNLQQLWPGTPSDVRSLYGTTYRLTPLPSAGQVSHHSALQSIKPDADELKQGIKSEVEAGMLSRVKELDLGQMTKETINGLIIVDEDSHKTVSPQDYIYKDESTGETQVRACEYCGKHFKYFSKLMEHIRSHTKQKPYKCSICGRTYTYKGDLTVHIRQHSSSKPFVCECGRAFASKKYLSVHQSQARIKGRHAIPKEAERSDMSYDCKICDRRFRFLSSYEMHMAGHESNGGGVANDIGEFACQTCGKVFKYLASYDLHLQVHQPCYDEIKQEDDCELYECQACNTCFKDHSLFVEHVLVHEKNKDGPLCPSDNDVAEDVIEVKVISSNAPEASGIQSQIMAVPLSAIKDAANVGHPLQSCVSVTQCQMLASITAPQLVSSTPTVVPSSVLAFPQNLQVLSVPSSVQVSTGATSTLTKAVTHSSDSVVNTGTGGLTASAQLRCLSEMATNSQGQSNRSRPRTLSETSFCGNPNSDIAATRLYRRDIVFPVVSREAPLSLVRASVTQTEADSTETTMSEMPTGDN